jgi:hypothetical protein
MIYIEGTSRWTAKHGQADTLRNPNLVWDWVASPESFRDVSAGLN